MTATTVTKAGLAKLISLLTGQSEQYILDHLSDDQVVGFEACLAEYVTPETVFNAASLQAAAASDPNLYTTVEAIVYAATSTPALVFTGAPGIAKLVAWATANTAAISADTPGHAALVAWAIAAIEKI